MKQLAKLWDSCGYLTEVLVLEEMDNERPAPVTCLGNLGNLRIRGKMEVGAKDLGRAGGQEGESVRHRKEVLCSLGS